MVTIPEMSEGISTPSLSLSEITSAHTDGVIRRELVSEECARWTEQPVALVHPCSAKGRAIVILHIQKEHVAQVPLAEDDDMVKAFSPDRADQPFRISILPWRAGRDWPVTNAHGTKPPDEKRARSRNPA